MPYKQDLEEIFSKSTATGSLARGRGRRRPLEVVDPLLTELSSQSQTEPTESTELREEEGLMASVEDGVSQRVLKRSSTKPTSSSSSPVPSKARSSSKRLKQSGTAEFNRTIMNLATAILENREKAQSQPTVK